MFKFSRKVEYALIAMVYMSRKKKDELTTARELSDKFLISLELIGKILQTLARKNLIISVQGVKGGYFLEKPIDMIQVSEIMTAIDGPIQLVRCNDSTIEKGCERQKICIIRKSMQNIQKQIANIFQSMSLRDFQENYGQTNTGD
jgi:Rrf2 family iron-sulfur cluster assembly transcriptional regulator